MAIGFDALGGAGGTGGIGFEFNIPTVGDVNVGASSDSDEDFEIDSDDLASQAETLDASAELGDAWQNFS